MRTATLTIPASSAKAFINLAKGEKLTGRYWVDGAELIPGSVVAEIYSTEVMEQRGYTIPATKVIHMANSRVMPVKVLMLASGATFSEAGDFYFKQLGEYSSGSHVAAIYNNDSLGTSFPSVVFEIS